MSATDQLEVLAGIKAANPQLRPMAGERSGLVAASKNIRIELKAAGIKARVRSSRFAGGDSIDVYLASDASDAELTQAARIASKYKAGRFDGMEDIYEYSHSPWTEMFGDAKYVHVQRDWKPREGGEAGA